MRNITRYYETGSLLTSRVAQWGMRGFIKSIQQGSISQAGTSATATITAVDVNNSLLFYDGFSSVGVTSTLENSFGHRITFTNSTTLTATSNATPASANSLTYYSVVELYPGIIKSIQRGSITFTSTTMTATITTVNINKSWIIYLGHEDVYAGGSGPGTSFSGFTLTNATTVTGVCQQGGSSSIGGFQVVEFF